MTRHRWFARAAAGMMLALVAAASIQPAARATDLEELRRRAQAVADEVSALEQQRSTLTEEATALEAEITKATTDIGALGLQIRAANRNVLDARDHYIERAVEAYKAGSTTRLALLLSAQTMSELLALAEATVAAGAVEGRALEELLAARDEVTDAQARADARKQELLVAQNEARALAVAMAGTIASRRTMLQELTAQIEKLEAQARAAAAVAAAAQGIDAGAEFLKLLSPSGPAPQIPKGFASTGVTFSGVASWYGPGFEGNHTASGDIFDSSLFTAASKELPLGTWLYVRHQGRGVVVLVNDRGPYIDGRILDLSRAAAHSIGITGLGWVDATILIKR